MIIVVGAGVAGASVAMSLAARGHREVVVHDVGPLGGGSTGAALGGFRTQHMTRINVDLSLRSRPWFEARAQRIGFQPYGYLYLAENAEVAAELARRAEVQRGFGLPIEHPRPSDKVPFLLDHGYQGANFCALDGLYSPRLVLETMVAEAEELGVTFRWGTVAAATDLDRAEAIVVAAGRWSTRVGSDLGVSLPIESDIRGVFAFGPYPWLENAVVPMTLEAGSGYHFRERDDRLCVMGPGDQFDDGHIREWLSRRVPAAAEGPCERWEGYYEDSFDHHPLLGATEQPRVFACCGFSGHGVMHAPAAGDALAAMILGMSPDLDIAVLSPLRTVALNDPTQL